MKKSEERPADASAATARRRAAEERLRQRHTPPDASLSEQDVRQLVHELQVHQIELEMQNEELRRRQEETSAALEKYAELYEFAPLAYLTLERDGIIRRLNRTAADLLGTEHTRLRGRRFGLFVAAADRPAFHAFVEKAFDTQAQHRCEITVLTAKGRRLFVRIAAAFSQTEQACSVVLSDLTERKRVEDELKAAHDQLRATVQAIPDLLFEVDAEGRILSYHAPVYDLTYTSPPEFLGRTVSEVLPEDAAHTMFEALAQATRHGWHRGASYSLETRNGRRWYELSVAAKKEPVGASSRFIVLARDITERKSSEDSLRRSQEQLTATLNALPDLLFELDRDGRIWDFRAPQPQFLYTAPEEFLGKRMAEVVPDEVAQVIQTGLAEAAETGRHFGAVYSLPLPQGLRWFEVSMAAKGDHRDPNTRFIVLVRDITKRKRAEAALQEKEAALTAAKEATAEAANRAKNPFLVNISHELRTPMNAILGMIELALQEKLPPAVQEHLQLAQNAAELQLELLNDILDFSRMESGKISLDAVPFNLHATVDEAVRVLGVKAWEKGCELCCDLPRHVPAHLIGDPLRLRQILSNLIGNAVKFTEVGEVIVRVAVESQTAETAVLRFSVTDTGIGISPEDQTLIFAPFCQADASTTRRYGGTGLGLAIASDLAGLMGGRLTVDSELGRGSTFSFTAQFLLQSEGLGPDPLESVFLERLREMPVLVVDGHATNRQILCATLAGWSMMPEEADTAATAVAKAQQARTAGRPFRLAIIEFSLGGSLALPLAQRLRKNQRQRPATILMVSWTQRQALVRARHPARDTVYLVKPVSARELLRTIIRSLRLASPSAPLNVPTALPAKAARSLRILLAEDTPAGRIFVTEVLQQRGHTVWTAENGREALELVRHRDFDLVLMDIQMPNMDGYQATAAIRALTDPTQSRLPIVALTAHARREDEQRTLTAGMDGFLSKPLKASVLIEMVERLAQQALAVQPESSADPAGEPSPDVAAPPTPAAHVFDLAEALDYCLTPSMFPKMVNCFFAEKAGLLEELRREIDAEHGAAIARLAHRLVGTVGYLGARATVAAARRLEQACQTGRPGTSELHAELESQVELLATALAPYHTTGRTNSS